MSIKELMEKELSKFKVNERWKPITTEQGINFKRI